MSYYILPRIETNISIMPSLFCSKDTIKPNISHSLVKYMKESHVILEQQLSLEANKSISISMLHQVIHTYDFLFSVVSGSENSISKINTNFSIYYDITEIYYTLKLYEGLPEIPINILCFGKASSSVSDAFKFHRTKSLAWFTPPYAALRHLTQLTRCGFCLTRPYAWAAFFS